MYTPLATRMRPESIAEFVGQEHILGKGKLLRRAIEARMIGSLLFHGPPSSGKTTLAMVIAQEMDAHFLTLNAVLDGVKELRSAVNEAERLRMTNSPEKAEGDHKSGQMNMLSSESTSENKSSLHNDTYKRTILFVDEIHRWNKAQQDALLPHIESGLLTLIGATTENPYYALVGPLLSRCQIFELKAFTTEDVELLIDRALSDSKKGLGALNIKLLPEARRHLAGFAAGDIRNALNALEMSALTVEPDEHGVRLITLEIAEESIQKRAVRYDGTGDEHYHYASAFIKSMRGSDVDAALYWMACMLEGGEDPMFIFRRMLIFASEDIGMADSFALTQVVSCQDAFERTGLPEGLYFLAHSCIYLSLAPKSNSSGAIFQVLDHLRTDGAGNVPGHLRDSTASKLESRYTGRQNASKNYKYPHSFPDSWVKQQYLPDSVTTSKWYVPGSQGREKALWERLMTIRKKSD